MKMTKTTIICINSEESRSGRRTMDLSSWCYADVDDDGNGDILLHKSFLIHPPAAAARECSGGCSWRIVFIHHRWRHFFPRSPVKGRIAKIGLFSPGSINFKDVLLSRTLFELRGNYRERYKGGKRCLKNKTERKSIGLLRICQFVVDILSKERTW